MDAVKFFKTGNRLCKNRTSGKCPIWKNGTCMNDFGDDSAKSIEETISKVEQWAKDHPVKNGLKHRMKVQTEAGKLALAVHGNPDGQHQSTNIACTVAQGWWN